MKTTTRSSVAILLMLGMQGLASAHVSLTEPRAEAGKPYNAVLRVGHGCEGSPTTAVAVEAPAALGKLAPVARPGWTASGTQGVITWTAQNKEAALGANERGEFALTGAVAPSKAGMLWLKVKQTCAQGSHDWAEIPAQGTSTAGLKSPAVPLEVLSAPDFALAQALPKVEGAWVRGSVPGQKATGAFMRLTTSEPMQLVGVASAAAGVAEVHEMKMEGDVMKMRAVNAVDLAPGQSFELKPGGYHIMLMDLKQPLAKDTSVGLTLLFRNARGAQARLEVKAPVAMAAPGTAAGAAADTHKH